MENESATPKSEPVKEISEDVQPGAELTNEEQNESTSNVDEKEEAEGIPEEPILADAEISAVIEDEKEGIILEQPDTSEDPPIINKVPETKVEDSSAGKESGKSITGDEENLEKKLTEETEQSAVADSTSETQGKTKSIDEDEASSIDEITQVQEESELSPEDSDSVQSNDEHEEVVDFEKFSKDELIDFIVELKNESDIHQMGRLLKEIRPRFDELYNESKSNALAAFLKEEGANKDDFKYRGDEADIKFNDYYGILKDKRSKFYHQLENQKEENLKTKNDILKRLREIVDDEQHVDINLVKILQTEWKNVGPVPGNQNKLLWANYNALLDRYYDSRSIYFELKELDRKKNLEAKIELCVKAEQLSEQDNLKEAIGVLNELHEEYKHIGPVPRDKQEELWQRFKASSDKIYEHRKSYVDEMKKELHENMEKKQVLSDRIEEFVSFTGEKISDWNKKTKEVLELQKKWDNIGGMPREKAKGINKVFWHGFKKFFANKSVFFKQFEANKEENLMSKEELVIKAQGYAESEDWEKTAQELKQLQQQWKDIGPVPDKHRNSIYEKFKQACDQFFNKRRNKNQEQDKEFEVNLTRKLAICDELEQLANAESIDPEQVYDLIDSYADLGFVPKHAIKKMHNRFDAVTLALTSAKGLSDEDRSELQLNIEVNKMKSGPHGDQKIHRKEGAMKRKVSSLEHDINIWTTNLDFFASSKNADKLKAEFEEKIEAAKKELDGLKSQLKILHQI